MNRRTVHVLTVACTLLSGPAVFGQSFNIDVGPAGPGPSAAYGAAGLPGFWNVVQAEHTTASPGPQAFDDILRDLDGNLTDVGLHQFGGMDLLTDVDPSVSGDDALLLDDAIVTHSIPLKTCFYFNGLDNGRYEYLTYAWMPNHPEVTSIAFIDNTPGTFTAGGAWPGQHVEGVTYTRHIVQVTNGFMGPHVGLPNDGDPVIGGPCNGVQLRKLCADHNDACGPANPVLSGAQAEFAFDTTCVATLGNGAAHSCGMIQRDLWVVYTPPDNGTITVSTQEDCQFDTALAVYAPATACTPGDGSLDQCADAPGDCETISTVVTAGAAIRIRVGSTAGEYGPGLLSITFEPDCASVADCADLNLDGVRDDGCLWWECAGGTCLSTEIPFADMGGAVGACPPDGAADANDRFHALNCFANADTQGQPPYPCEANPPAAFNVDAGGPFGACAPDGVCDGHDAFHALNAFEGSTSCGCPAGPGPVLQSDGRPAGKPARPSAAVRRRQAR